MICRNTRYFWNSQQVRCSGVGRSILQLPQMSLASKSPSMQTNDNVSGEAAEYLLWARQYPTMPQLRTEDDSNRMNETLKLISERTQDATEIEATAARLREILGPDAEIATHRMQGKVSFWFATLTQRQLEEVEKLHGVGLRATGSRSRRGCMLTVLKVESVQKNEDYEVELDAPEEDMSEENDDLEDHLVDGEPAGSS